jgi:hypothetical protein
MSDAKVTVTFDMVTVDDDRAPDEVDPSNYLGCTPAEVADYCAQDAERIERYNRDEWRYIGIQARATVVVAHGTHSTMYRITSAGLWGIESGSDEAYLQSVFEDERETLLEDIKLFGTVQS